MLRLLSRHFRSVEKLEIALLLRRTRSGWNGPSVAHELRIDARSAADRLEELSGDGFLRRDDDAYVYDAPADVDRDVEQLARCYAERRVSVITAMFSQPTDHLRMFAEAFRLKGKS